MLFTHSSIRILSCCWSGDVTKQATLIKDNYFHSNAFPNGHSRHSWESCMCPRQGASHTTDNVETKSGCIYSTQILSRHCRPSPAHCALSGTLTRLTQVQNFAFTFYTSETILCIDTFSSKLYNIHSYKTQSAPQQTYEG